MTFPVLRRAGVLAIAGLALSACSSEGDRAYSACIDQIEQSVAEITEQSGSAAAPMIEMTRSMGTTACEALRTACNNDPKGAMCQSAIAELTR